MIPPSKPSALELWDDSLDGSPPSKGVADAGPRAWRIIVIGSTVLWLLVAIEAFSDAAPNLIIFLLRFGFGMILAMAWLFWTFCLSRGHLRHQSGFEVAQWAFVPLTGLLGIILLMTNLDFGLRLRLSEPAHRRCIAELSARPEGSDGEDGGRVGLFRFESFGRRDGCIVMRSGATCPEGGLIYCLVGRPPQWSPEYSFRYVRGPWRQYQNNL